MLLDRTCTKETGRQLVAGQEYVLSWGRRDAALARRLGKLFVALEDAEPLSLARQKGCFSLAAALPISYGRLAVCWRRMGGDT
jgi:hypothetical protein